MTENCFHCGEPIPADFELLINIDNEQCAMCCYGCNAVAEQIIAFGLTDYYRHRTALPEKPETLIPEELAKLTIFNNPQIQSEFVSHADDSTKETKLIIEGISCPACVWLIESRIAKLHGIKQVSVNYSTQRCRISWREEDISLSAILTTISQLGYNALPYNHKQRELIYETERKTQLLRLGIAGLFGMQVMMIAIALYFGEATGIEKQYKIFFYWISLLLTLPVLIFSARPIFIGAIRDIKNKRPGMDIPIALGLSIAFCSSLWTIFQQNGVIYYDSIVMFIFFILSGRYFEFMSRKKSTAYLDRASSILPLYATRINSNGEKSIVDTNVLSVSDKVLVKPGEVIPVDGVIYEGCSTVNESIITGESLPVTKNHGMNVIAGSTNTESPLFIEVNNIGEHTVLSNISRIIEQASSSKPATVLLANRIVSVFISSLLVITCLVAIYWYHADQEQWLAITIAVLVVSCPCALSLATPTVLSSAAMILMQNGIALINNDAIEEIEKSDCFVFDKTGTLTKGNLKLQDIDIFDTSFSRDNILVIASALESASEHPIANAIEKATKNTVSVHASNIINTPGQGIRGEINGEWFIGTEQYINDNCFEKSTNKESNLNPLRKIFLANAETIIAALYFDDELRDTSHDLIQYLKHQGKRIILMSGDHSAIVEQVAAQLEIEEVQSELKPEDKLNNIAELQQQGYRVCMIGDGVNDAPAFAQANVAIAMTDASDITKLNADMLLLNNSIDTLKTMFKIILKTNRTIHINFAWALAYNLTALPFAIAGYIAPWMAALGMSLSSLIVVINATKVSTTDYS